MKAFILMTTGRAGSTALMDALAKHDDIAVPSKQIDCIDNEILNPAMVKNYIPFYQKFQEKPINTEIELINCFYQSNAKSAYAGFKSMPGRHKSLNLIFNTPAIQVITLSRRDIASTIASFIIAIDEKTWRREGSQQEFSFTFDNNYKDRVLGHLKYILDSQAVLSQFPRAIHLEFEDLCEDSFSNHQLNQYFGRHIQLENPKTPINAASYVNNWESFKEFIVQSAQTTV